MRRKLLKSLGVETHERFTYNPGHKRPAYTLALDADRPIKGPTLARLPSQHAEPIDTAPRGPDTSIMLFCPEQAAGTWASGR
jgi:hypothetical protein